MTEPIRDPDALERDLNSWVSSAPVPFCVLCNTPIEEYEAWTPLNAEQYAHHECGLREVVGGIGHQIAHKFWCVDHHDPDAGLTYRQSAKMVAAFVDVVGIDEVSRRGVSEVQG